jgi:hypothetical protein
MQRDMDLVVTLLGAFRDAPVAALTIGQLTQAVQHPSTGDISAEKVEHHLELLCDAGLVIQVSEGYADSAATWRLTWQGYDTLDGDDDEDDDAD